MKILVGVMPLFDDKKESIWMLPHYMNMLERHHFVPFIFPYTTNKEVLLTLAKQVDGLLFTGGHDINPSYYNEDKKVECGETLAIRDEMELFLLDFAFKNDIPSFGICRGLQLFNVFQGGTLYQDIKTQNKTSLSHQQSIPYDQAIHKIYIKQDSLIFDGIRQTEYSVNSIHHQAIKVIAPQTEAIAIAEDGIIEAIKINSTSFAVAVQWHPEYLPENDPLSHCLMSAFYAACHDFHTRKGK